MLLPPHYALFLEDDRWLADHTEVIYIMPRGLGNSAPVREPKELTYLQNVHDLEAVRRKLNLGRWVVKGKSGGSQVTLLYALTYPDALVGIMPGLSVGSISRAFNTTLSVVNPLNPVYQADLATLDLNKVTKLPAVVSSYEHYWVQPSQGHWLFFRGEVPLVGLPAENISDKLKAALEEVAYFEIAERLAGTDVPCLVTCGENDQVVPLEECLCVRKEIPGAELLLLENSGHGISEMDRAMYQEKVLNFLSKLSK